MSGVTTPGVDAEAVERLIDELRADAELHQDLLPDRAADMIAALRERAEAATIQAALAQDLIRALAMQHAAAIRERDEARAALAEHDRGVWNAAIEAAASLEPDGRRWISRKAIRALRRDPKEDKSHE